MSEEVNITRHATEKIIRFIEEVVKTGKSVPTFPIAGINLACRFYTSTSEIKKARSSGFLTRLMWGGGAAKPSHDRYIDCVEDSLCQDDTVYAIISVDNMEIARVWNDKLFVELPDPMTEYIYMTLNNVPLRCQNVETVYDSSFLKFTTEWHEKAIDLNQLGHQKLHFQFSVGGKRIVNVETTIEAKSFSTHCQKLTKGGDIQESTAWSIHLPLEKISEQERQKERQMYKHKTLELKGERRNCVIGHEGSRQHVAVNFDTSDLRPEHQAAIRVEVYIPFNAKNMAMCFSRYQAACLKEASGIGSEDEDGGLSLEKISKGVYCPGHWTIYSKVINKLAALLIPTEGDRGIARAVRPLALGVMTISENAITFKQYIDPDSPLYESMERERHSGVTTEVIQRPQEKIMWEYPDQIYLPYTRGMQMSIPNGAWDAHTFYVVDLDDVRKNGVATYSSLEDAAKISEVIARRNRSVPESNDAKTWRTCYLCVGCYTAPPGGQASPTTSVFGSAVDPIEEHL